MPKKTRLDLLLVEKGLAPTRSKAQALILSGDVLVDDSPVTKPGTEFNPDVPIRMRGETHPYVARSALKLIAALDEFKIEVQDRIAIDVGASTGGFTEVLLERGAARVHAVDVGHNQLDWKIRNHPKVQVREKLNARNLTPEDIGEEVEIIVVDVSFISLDKILSPLLSIAKPNSDWITLIKPQFEVGRDRVGKGGIVRSEEDRQSAVDRITQFSETIGLARMGLIKSPITGTDGNQEYLAHWKIKHL